ncbi:LysR family transcriptional regulator [Zhihengliuella flava]|uniref:DNA-binding transcriptional LysR family regulator n=1 Tax=Zhihengliuella flava TaxID=1285193 RepID=A0A931GES9_9MICC|nr:LysR family transcriptional regulator [Zhihengliuella flava]MBG6083897.1 DNA-binding transcriptional LysR family regulator [Zhihengliuella flava]
MDLHQLTLLRELRELGSVKAVADSLLVTPSAVSQHLAQLQRSVAVPLTRKHGRTLVLTEAGEVLAEAGADVVAAMARARAAISAFHEDASAQVRVSGFHSAGQALFAPLLRVLEQHDGAAPAVSFTDEDVAEQDFPALTAQYDLVLAHRMEHRPPRPSGGVSIMELAREPLDVAVPAGHRLAARQALEAADVVSEPWVTSRPGYSPDDVLSAIGALASAPPRVVHRINDYSTIAALVAEGGVLGLLPRYTSRRALGAQTGVVLKPLRGLNTKRRIDLMARPEALERASVRAVVSAFEAVMAELITPQSPPAAAP